MIGCGGLFLIMFLLLKFFEMRKLWFRLKLWIMGVDNFCVCKFLLIVMKGLMFLVRCIVVL